MKKIILLVILALFFSCSKKTEKKESEKRAPVTSIQAKVKEPKKIKNEIDSEKVIIIDTLKPTNYTKEQQDSINFFKREDSLSMINPRKTCNQIWEEYIKRQQSVDSIIKNLINNNQNVAESNLKLLESILNQNDSTLEIHRPLAPIFEGIDSLPFIISNIMWIESESNGRKSWTTFTPEDYIIDRYDTFVARIDPENPEETVQAYFENTEARKNFPQAIKENSELQKSIFVYTKKSMSIATISSIGKQNSECDGGYIFYNFETNTKDNLISSPYNLDLEFGNWKKIDSIIANNPLYNCFDCPNSYKEGRTFAKLKGIPNTYFIYAGELQNAKDLNTPYRSLIYVDDNNNLYSLWSKEIDLFGCACL